MFRTHRVGIRTIPGTCLTRVRDYELEPAQIPEDTMTSTPMSRTPPSLVASPRYAHRLRVGLLLCGIISSLLYVATDIVGGIRYDDYSFTSQAVSELMAAGAPSERIVDPLFLTYDALVIAFSLGVVRIAHRRRRALRLTGWLLMAYGTVGMMGPTLFEMHRRGTGGGQDDIPHIIVTAVIVVVTLGAMGAGAFALGTRFRTYSFATLLVMVVAGVIAASFGADIAAGKPTPGFGIVERIDIYASLLWVAVLSVALLRSPPSLPIVVEHGTRDAHVNGFVAVGFENVMAEFQRNFVERGEIGAAVAAYRRGAKVVDLWGGSRTPNGSAQWNSDTMVVVMSTTKGLAAMTLAVANSRGWLDYDAPIARYWPEFAQNGKEAITVRQLLAHEAGLVLLDERLDVDKMHDLDYVARVLARQTPAWPPGTRHGYHTITLGLYMQELIRRVDPAHRTLGQFFQEEIAAPLGIDFFIRLPRGISPDRLAVVKPLSPWRGLLALRYTPFAVTMKMIRPGSLLRRSFAGLVADPNDRGFLDIEVPAGNGVGTARAIARAYSAFAEGGAELGITPQTFAQVTAPPDVANPIDDVLGLPSYFSLGFLRPGPDAWFGSSPRAFGAPGAGGSFAFADPDMQLGYAYVMNKLDFYLTNDPREKALRDAIYRAIAVKQADEQCRIEPDVPAGVG